MTSDLSLPSDSGPGDRATEFTSRMAELSARPGRWHLAAMIAEMPYGQPMTAEEIEDNVVGGTPSGVRTRIAELRQLGILFIADRAGVTRAGRPANRYARRLMTTDMYQARRQGRFPDALAAAWREHQDRTAREAGDAARLMIETSEPLNANLLRPVLVALTLLNPDGSTEVVASFVATRRGAAAVRRAVEASRE